MSSSVGIDTPLSLVWGSLELLLSPNIIAAVAAPEEASANNAPLCASASAAFINWGIFIFDDKIPSICSLILLVISLYFLRISSVLRSFWSANWYLKLDGIAATVLVNVSFIFFDWNSPILSIIIFWYFATFFAVSLISLSISSFVGGPDDASINCFLEPKNLSTFAVQLSISVCIAFVADSTDSSGFINTIFSCILSFVFTSPPLVWWGLPTPSNVSPGLFSVNGLFSAPTRFLTPCSTLFLTNSFEASPVNPSFSACAFALAISFCCVCVTNWFAGKPYWFFLDVDDNAAASFVASLDFGFSTVIPKSGDFSFKVPSLGTAPWA